MMGTVHLHHLSIAVLSLPPLTVLSLRQDAFLFSQARGVSRLIIDPFHLLKLLGERVGPKSV